MSTRRASSGTPRFRAEGSWSGVAVGLVGATSPNRFAFTASCLSCGGTMVDVSTVRHWRPPDIGSGSRSFADRPCGVGTRPRGADPPGQTRWRRGACVRHTTGPCWRDGGAAAPQGASGVLREGRTGDRAAVRRARGRGGSGYRHRDSRVCRREPGHARRHPPARARALPGLRHRSRDGGGPHTGGSLVHPQACGPPRGGGHRRGLRHGVHPQPGAVVACAARCAPPVAHHPARLHGRPAPVLRDRHQPRRGGVPGAHERQCGRGRADAPGRPEPPARGQGAAARPADADGRVARAREGLSGGCAERGHGRRRRRANRC